MTAFIFILISVSLYLPVDILIIEGITEEDINALREEIVLPEQAGVLDYLIYFFSYTYSVMIKILVLLRLSTPHQFIALIITPFVVGLSWSIARLVRGGG